MDTSLQDGAVARYFFELLHVSNVIQALTGSKAAFLLEVRTKIPGVGPFVATALVAEVGD
jgi:hypothetical protein